MFSNLGLTISCEECPAEPQLSNLAAQDANNANSTNNNAIPEKVTGPAGEENESDPWLNFTAGKVNIGPE